MHIYIYIYIYTYIYVFIYLVYKFINIIIYLYLPQNDDDKITQNKMHMCVGLPGPLQTSCEPNKDFFDVIKLRRCGYTNVTCTQLANTAPKHQITHIFCKLYLSLNIMLRVSFLVPWPWPCLLSLLDFLLLDLLGKTAEVFLRGDPFLKPPGRFSFCVFL